MAFRIEDLSLQVEIYTAGGQPGGCTCGPASGAVKRPGCGASGKPDGGGGGGKPKPSGTPKKRALNALRSQLRETLAPAP
jgi:hypothetical protein